MTAKRARTAELPMYARVASCAGLCALVADCLMDDEIANWLQTNRRTREVVCGSAIIWWTRYRRQYECWTAYADRKRLEGEGAALEASWRIRDAHTREMKRLRERAWQWVCEHWTALGAPPHATWFSQYRAYVIGTVGVRTHFAAIDCDSHTLHCWLPYEAVQHDYMSRSHTARRDSLDRLIRKREAAALRWVRRHNRLYATEPSSVAHATYLAPAVRAQMPHAPYVYAASRIHRQNAIGTRYRNVVQYLGVREKLDHIMRMASAGTAFCVHAVHIYGLNFQSAQDAVERTHRDAIAATHCRSHLFSDAQFLSPPTSPPLPDPPLTATTVTREPICSPKTTRLAATTMCGGSSRDTDVRIAHPTIFNAIGVVGGVNRREKGSGSDVYGAEQCDGGASAGGGGGGAGNGNGNGIGPNAETRVRAATLDDATDVVRHPALLALDRYLEGKAHAHLRSVWETKVMVYERRDCARQADMTAYWGAASARWPLARNLSSRRVTAVYLRELYEESRILMYSHGGGLASVGDSVVVEQRRDDLRADYIHIRLCVAGHIAIAQSATEILVPPPAHAIDTDNCLHQVARAIRTAEKSGLVSYLDDMNNPLYITIDSALLPVAVFNRERAPSPQWSLSNMPPPTSGVWMPFDIVNVSSTCPLCERRDIAQYVAADIHCAGFSSVYCTSCMAEFGGRSVPWGDNSVLQAPVALDIKELRCRQQRRARYRNWCAPVHPFEHLGGALNRGGARPTPVTSGPYRGLITFPAFC